MAYLITMVKERQQKKICVNTQNQADAANKAQKKYSDFRIFEIVQIEMLT